MGSTLRHARGFVKLTLSKSNLETCNLKISGCARQYAERYKKTSTLQTEKIAR